CRRRDGSRRQARAPRELHGARTLPRETRRALAPLSPRRLRAGELRLPRQGGRRGASRRGTACELYARGGVRPCPAAARTRPPRQPRALREAREPGFLLDPVAPPDRRER